MKKFRCPPIRPGQKKVACTISAAALMLGVSSAATVGLNFQVNYCAASAYTGFPVTLTAFGVAPSSWQNLTPMNTGYGCDDNELGYTYSEQIGTTVTNEDLNPIPNGSITVTWFGPTANYTPFGGYAGTPPNYYHQGGTGGALALNTAPVSGEAQVYAGFIRDGINFGPPGGPNNSQPGYTINITGLKSLFTNSQFVVELIASSDSMETLTNAQVIDVPGLTTNLVSYPSTPPVANSGDAPWVRGPGGGLSTVTSVNFNTDHILIQSVHPQHVAGEFNHAGNISGAIITDKPVVTMSPHQTLSLAGDTVQINPYVIGVTPLSYQWRLNGVPIPGGTSSNYTVTSVSMANIGSYDLVVTNLYGAATSGVVVVGDPIMQGTAKNVVVDSNPTNATHAGVNNGAVWQATNSDGATTRTGVLSFTAADSNGVTVADDPAFDGNVGTVTFWMRSAGTDLSSPGTTGASILCRPTGTLDNDFVLLQLDGSPGNIYFQSPANGATELSSSAGVSDNKWHFVALTFDATDNGGAAIYIDGALDSTNSTSASWSISGQPLQIGYSTDPTFREYNGLLDDFRFYNAILSASQIAQIHASDAIANANSLQLQFNFTTAPGNGLTLTWQAAGAVLQTAPTVAGPWTDLPAGTASPYTIVPGPTQQFFKYRISHTPQSVVTNPYLM
jgi:hypothetical protein